MVEKMKTGIRITGKQWIKEKILKEKRTIRKRSQHNASKWGSKNTDKQLFRLKTAEKER